MTLAFKSAEYRPDVDGLRAIAVLSIVAFHFGSEYVPGGFVGVDIFFVISGYLITGILLKGLASGSFSFWDFYARRIRRIFPALIVVLVATWVTGWFVLLADEFSALGKQIAGSAVFAANFVFWREAGYFDIAAELKPLLHLWSLGVEEQFYVVWPVLLYLAWKSGFNTLAVLVLIGLASFALNVSLVGGHPVATFYLPMPRFWELLLGGLLAHFERHEPRLPRVGAFLRNAGALLGIALILCSIFGLDRTKTFPGWWALFPVVGASLLIFGGRHAWINERVLAHRALVFVGLISYPLYLWHWPILSFARISEPEGLPAGVLLFGVFLSFLLSWLTYRFVEIPIRSVRKVVRKTIAVACVAMVALGLLGFATYENGGFAKREAAKASTSSNAWPAAFQYDARCVEALPALFPTFNANSDFCIYDRQLASKGRTIAVLGDSHANFAYVGLAASLAPDYRFLHLGRGTCLPLLNIASYARNVDMTCQPLVNDILNFVSGSDEVSSVVLGGFFNQYLDGRIVIKSTVPGRETLDASEVFEKALTDTVDLLLRKHKLVYVLRDVPELPFSPATCIVRKFTFVHNQGCRASQAAYLEKDQRQRSIIDRLKARYPEIVILDPSAVLCDGNYCYAKKNGTLLYRDSDHLNYNGAAMVGKNFAAEFGSAKGR